MLTGKKAFITGGGSRIGRCCAEVFIKYGAEVVITGHGSKEKLQKVVEELGPKCYGIRGDVSIFSEMETAFAFALEKLGEGRHWTEFRGFSRDGSHIRYRSG